MLLLNRDSIAKCSLASHCVFIAGKQILSARNNRCLNFSLLVSASFEALNTDGADF
jgi:hypothetical protein